MCTTIFSSPDPSYCSTKFFIKTMDFWGNFMNSVKAGPVCFFEPTRPPDTMPE